MATIEVRGLDEETIRNLERRAAANGRTVEEEARAILGSVSATMRDLDDQRAAFNDWVHEWFREAGKGPGPHPKLPSEVALRWDRDYGHRIL